MKPDPYLRVVFTVIAVALCLIAWKLVFDAPPTQGDFIALTSISDIETRRATHDSLVKKIPFVRVHGGQIDAEVSGTVSISD